MLGLDSQSQKGWIATSLPPPATWLLSEKPPLPTPQLADLGLGVRLTWRPPKKASRPEGSEVPRHSQCDP